MIKEAYCSFEVAKLLKEKGFNEPCEWVYDPNCASFAKSYSEPKNSELNEYEYSKPTHQMALAWLREEYNIFIEIGTSIDLTGNYHFNYAILDKECKYVRRRYTSFDYNYEDASSYEKAVEAAIKYCLENLI